MDRMTEHDFEAAEQLLATLTPIIEAVAERIILLGLFCGLFTAAALVIQLLRTAL